jgi:hypothetical protein
VTLEDGPAHMGLKRVVVDQQNGCHLLLKLRSPPLPLRAYSCALTFSDGAAGKRGCLRILGNFTQTL